ncbi:MAG: ribbon-helix-helix protein, CopG family [Nitrospira sp.]|nr:MAG: ribbon-helix-helix protein, CopG family [Nitrospira sp.]
MMTGSLRGFALRTPFSYTDYITKCSILSEGATMATLTISFSDEEMRRLEELSAREGLTVEQIVRLSINDFIGLPDDAFRTAAKRVMEKNSELYRRLS